MPVPVTVPVLSPVPVFFPCVLDRAQLRACPVHRSIRASRFSAISASISAKYSTSGGRPLQNLCNVDPLLSGRGGKGLGPALLGYINASIARSSWQKYASGWRAFLAFEDFLDAKFALPLDAQTWRAFVTWCLAERRLQATTVSAYLSAVIFVHHLQGACVADPHKDPVIILALRGAKNLAFASPPKPNLRRVVTFPLLRLLAHRVARTSWCQLSKQVIWTCCTVAFFTSARLGELLADSESAHDVTANLMWRDVLFCRNNSAILHLKANKSVHPEGEFLDVFPFPGYGCCPLSALRELRAQQVAAGVFDAGSPVFRFGPGRNVTHSLFNKLLATLLQDICAPGENAISCHSFRAGVPTALSRHPDLCSSDDIKGWGRWASDCYTRYTRLRHDQREQILRKIAVAIVE